MNRVKELRTKIKYTQGKLAEYLNVHQTAVSQWETGRTSPDKEIAANIAKLCNVTLDYVLGLDSEPNANFDADLPLTFDNIFPITKKRFPLLGEIACGEPIYADEDRESYVTAGADIQADFCLRAKGDSMIGARIWDGDIVFIKEMSMVNNGEIAAVIVDDEATLKRVYYDHDKAQLILQAENPKYAPKVIIGEELNTVRILGKAIAFQSDVR